MLNQRSRKWLRGIRESGALRGVRTAGRYLWREWIRPVAPLVLVLMTLRGAVADWNDVPTGSMYPTIEIGDRVFVNKLAYGLRIPFTHAWIAQWGGPERGEIAVLTSPTEDKRLVKRVVGLPGDVIEMKDNVLVINGRPLEYAGVGTRTNADLVPGMVLRQTEALESLDAHRHSVLATPALQAHRTFGPLRVPEGQYFVMGDNRDMSADSRAIGFVPRRLLIGRSTHVVLSFDPERWYLPRLDRIWKELP
jgi:signal peptidase I